MKAPFSYYGGKTGMAPRIVELMPPHRVYLEPFLGSGAVLFEKAPAQHEIVNDLDGALVTFFRVLRDRPLELEQVCRLTPYARAEFAAAELDEPLEDLELARRFWVRVNQSFAKSAGRVTGWSVTTARTQAAPATVASRLDRMHACAERLLGVSIEQCDAADLVRRLATDDALVYADPPYLDVTRRSRGVGKAPTDYRCDMGTELEHRNLADALHTTPATVILSGYRSELYDDLYGDWFALDFMVTAHSSNAARGDRSSRVETLWSNRELGHGRLFA